MRVSWISLMVLAGCGVLPASVSQEPAVGEARSGVTSDVLVRPQARSNDVAIGAAPLPAAATGALGRTVASLGDATQPGLWLKTPLVQTEQAGRVSFPGTGKSVAVTLIPIEGPLTAGSRLSLAAMQAIGAPLTGLPEIDVFSGA
jgi:hypothetical protein